MLLDQYNRRWLSEDEVRYLLHKFAWCFVENFDDAVWTQPGRTKFDPTLFPDWPAIRTFLHRRADGQVASIMRCDDDLNEPRRVVIEEVAS